MKEAASGCPCGFAKFGPPAGGLPALGGSLSEVRKKQGHPGLRHVHILELGSLES